mgnify:CR=1 FL=1
MNKLKLITVMLAVAALVQTGDACTVVIAGKKATVDGSVLNSHTDCGPDCRIQVVPGQKYPKGTMAPVYYGILTRNRPEMRRGDSGVYSAGGGNLYLFSFCLFPY